MPIMNGYDAIKSIHKLETELKIPSVIIVALSASVMESEIANAFKSGWSLL